ETAAAGLFRQDYPILTTVEEALSVKAMVQAMVPSEVAAMQSLCEKCALMQEVVTHKGSRFLLCQLSQTDTAFPKYPRQPVVHCDGYQPRAKNEKESNCEGTE